MPGKAAAFFALSGALVALAGIAAAAPMSQPPDATADSLPRLREPIVPEHSEKSRAVAFGWSLLGTAVPVIAGEYLSGKVDRKVATGLTLSGMLVGPSLGQFYAGSVPHGLLGMGIRGAGGFMGTYGLILTYGNLFCGIGDGSDNDCDDGTGPTLAFIGLFTYLTGALYSLYDGGAAVGRYNEGIPAPQTFGFAPMAAPGSDGAMRTGAVAWMRF